MGKLPHERTLSIGRTVGSDTHEGSRFGKTAALGLVAVEVRERLIDKAGDIEREHLRGRKRDHVAAVAKTLARTILEHTVIIVELGANSRVVKSLEGVIAER